MILFWAALLSCSCKRSTVAPPVEPIPVAATVPPSGEVIDGRFTDARWGYSMAVPEGWSAEPMRDDGSIRLALNHAATGSRMEVWIFAGQATGFRPRSDCRWTFEDRARYRVRGGSEPLTVGSCTPLEPDGPLVQGWLLPGPEATAQVELRLPEGALVQGQRASVQVLNQFRWGL